MSFHQRLKETCKKKDTTISALISEFGMSSSNVTSWKNGVTPKIDVVSKFAERLDTTTDYLIFGKENQSLTEPEKEFLEKYRACPPTSQQLIDNVLNYEYRRLSHITEVVMPKKIVKVYEQRVSAGLGNYLSQDVGYQEMEFNEDIIPPKTDYGIVVSGDSMNPEIPNGTIVFVKSAPAIDNGKVGIFSLNGEAYCKRLSVNHEQHKIRLLSTNPEYSPIDIRPEDELYTFGEVVGHSLI